MNRVVVTGYGAISPFGVGGECLFDNLWQMQSAVRHVCETKRVAGIRTDLAAIVPEVNEKSIPRKFRRSMSAMSIYATLAAKEALSMGGLDGSDLAEVGLVAGSTIGSTLTTEKFFRDFLRDESLERMRSTVFFQIMNHSVAANLVQVLGLGGRVLAPGAACATGCQAVGLAYELIAAGRQTQMLCGGADEFHPLTVATFDIMNAAASGAEDPQAASCPFDEKRQGLVCGEGAGFLLLESLPSALRRKATILGEVVGFASLADSGNIANPDSNAMERCMRQAIEDAGLGVEELDYINAHATATPQGDVAEATAIARLVGTQVPVSSLKGHLGHTMAASGALELIATLQMLQSGMLIPTRNLERPDPLCGGISLLTEPTRTAARVALKNSFALGGIDSSLVVRSYQV
ncbi:beta-ketoacyl-[acyl-carrier-protein] synthase family protein [Geothermobacter hydrogeniphilus]|nr:beta-ketoacyl-[acyl-carrier-protein] synthase family protein [Geothermobacter hydrogeniphilus]